MKKIIIAVACVALGFSTVSAQGFFDKLNKGLQTVNKTLDDVNKALQPQETQKQEEEEQQKTTRQRLDERRQHTATPRDKSLNNSSKTNNGVQRTAEIGGSLQNQGNLGDVEQGQSAAYFNLEVVDCEGDAAAGEVLLTVSATPVKAQRLQILSNGEDFASDARGNRYNLVPLNHNYSSSREMVKGVPMLYELLITDVDPSVKELAVVNMSFYAGSSERNLGSNMTGVEPIQIRHLPIRWNRLPSSDVVSETYQLRAMCDVNISDCRYDNRTGAVILTLSATTNSPRVRLQLGSNGTVTAYDARGKQYTGKSTEGSSGSKQLDRDVPTLWEFGFYDIPQDLKQLKAVKVDFYGTDDSNNVSAGSNMSNVPAITLRNVDINR